MNKWRYKSKLFLTRQHRLAQYEKAIQGVIDGTISPEYATERFNKLKEIKRK